MTEAESNIQSVLESLGLKHVVQVDDANVAGISLERVLEAGGGFLDWPEWVEHGVTAIDAPFDENWRRQVERHWDSLADADQQSFANAVLGAAGKLDDGNATADVGFQAAIKELFGGASFEALSLGEWQTRSKEIIDRAKEERTLVLFDLHFEREARQDRYGVELLKLHKNDDHLTLGLLSHQPAVADEPQLWKQISTETSVAPDRFVVLSKRRLADNNPELLVDGLRRTVLAKAVGQVKSTCGSILSESVSQAESAVNAISVYDFDQAIFRSSRVEGVWEGDTFFRVFNAAVRRAAQRKMYESSELRGQIADIRRKFPHTSKIDDSVARSAWELHRREVYEDHDFVNRHLLPVANGDIFQIRKNSAFKDGKDRLFVLVVQPCDLAVRDSGLRGNEEGIPKFSHMAYLVEIPSAAKAIPSFAEVTTPIAAADGATQEMTQGIDVATELQDALQRASDLEQQITLASGAYDGLAKRTARAETRPTSRFELPYFDGGSPNSRYIAVGGLHHAWLAALDLCALNASGEALLPLDVVLDDELLLPGWTVRAAKLQDYFKSLLSLIPADVPAPQQAELRDALIPAACRSRTMKASVEGDPGARLVKYGIKRVGRLAPDRAAALLGRVAAHLSRPAFEHDLAREDA
ncbi:MAG: hypothetical protein H6747_13870 [Deltaproteobacteria bacterium]|nr:hypothetical protein [Deltaproteobacteria bacterium]